MSFVRSFTRIQKCEDVFVNENGIEPFDVHKMVAEGRIPETPPCILVHTTHWFGLVKRKYLIVPHFWIAGIVVDLPESGKVSADTINKTFLQLNKEGKDFSVELATAIAEHSLMRIRELKENRDGSGEPVKAQVINLADRLKK